ncbi:uncharacterized protein [Montipora foliosa]|uniref:uncharacterized protein n=1 Tax=Montipora foliosa TaxID=591990 RepID=UPI0035F1001A
MWRRESITVSEGLFVATTSSIVNFVREFNKFFRCPSMEGRCKGSLVLVSTSKAGLGGSMRFVFQCNGYWEEEINYQSSRPHWGFLARIYPIARLRLPSGPLGWIISDRG